MKKANKYEVIVYKHFSDGRKTREAQTFNNMDEALEFYEYQSDSVRQGMRENLLSWYMIEDNLIH